MKRKLQVGRATLFLCTLNHTSNYNYILINSSTQMEFILTSLKTICSTGLQTRAGGIQFTTKSLWIIISSKYHLLRKNQAKAHSGGQILPQKANEQGRLPGKDGLGTCLALERPWDPSGVQPLITAVVPRPRRACPAWYLTAHWLSWRRRGLLSAPFSRCAEAAAPEDQAHHPHCRCPLTSTSQ